MGTGLFVFTNHNLLPLKAVTKAPSASTVKIYGVGYSEATLGSKPHILAHPFHSGIPLSGQDGGVKMLFKFTHLPVFSL